MTKIPVQCPSCSRRYAAPAKRAGQSLNCPECQTAIPVPAATQRKQTQPQAKAATKRSPASASAPQSRAKAASTDNNSRLLIIVGAIGGGAVLLVLIMIVVSSLGGGDANEVAQADAPPAQPVRVEHTVDPWYEANQWVRSEDPQGRFYVWSPSQAEIDDRDGEVSIDSGLGDIYYRTGGPSSPRQALQRERQMFDNATSSTHTVMAESSGEHNGMRFQETRYSVSSPAGKDVYMYVRMYAGNGWIAILNWTSPFEDTFDDERRIKFAEGFQALIESPEA